MSTLVAPNALNPLIDDNNAAKAIEVAAMLGDSVVDVKHCMDPKSGTVSRKTWGLAAAGLACVLASAASFADWISAPFTRSRTVMRSPPRRPIDEPPALARPSTVTVSVSLWCSSATSTVISFVIDAIGTGARACRAARIAPLPAFTTT